MTEQLTLSLWVDDNHQTLRDVEGRITHKRLQHHEGSMGGR